MKKLDIYILKNFILTLVFSLLALYMIFIIVTLMENLDNFIDNNVSTMRIIEYYIYYLPEIIKLVTPLSILLATLFSVGRLTNTNEVTAMKSGGMSMYRIMLPIATMTLFLSLFQVYFNGWVVPSTVVKKNEIERVDLRKNRKTSSVYDLYLRDSPTRNLSMQYYTPKGKYGRKVAVEYFEGDGSLKINERYDALNIRWNEKEKTWYLEKGIYKNFRGDTIISYDFDKVQLDLNINHDQLVKLKKGVDEMNFNELRKYIDVMKLGGKDVNRMMIDYYGEWAFPFADIIIVLFGVPFASIRRKGGTAVQFAAALVVSFTYLIFTEISKTIGYSTSINPILIGWSANIFFTIIGIIVLLRTRT